MPGTNTFTNNTKDNKVTKVKVRKPSDTPTKTTVTTVNLLVQEIMPVQTLMLPILQLDLEVAVLKEPKGKIKSELISTETDMTMVTNKMDSSIESIRRRLRIRDRIILISLEEPMDLVITITR